MLSSFVELNHHQPPAPSCGSFGGKDGTSTWSPASSECHLTQLYSPLLISPLLHITLTPYCSTCLLCHIPYLSQQSFSFSTVMIMIMLSLIVQGIPSTQHPLSTLSSL